jgi:hypothetical protein
MAATAQQGTYLGITLIGFTALPAGLMARSDHPAAGILIAVVGAGLLLYSAFGFYRCKSVEYTK